MDKLIAWLFTDPISACVNATSAGHGCALVPHSNPAQYVEVFHFYAPWLIVCALGLLVPGYYWVEGRKRLMKGHVLHKYMLDKFMNQVALLAFVGPFIMFGRWALDSSFFAFRFWRYAWLAWALGIGIYWLVYFIRRYPAELAAYRTHRTLSQYVPGPRARRRPVAKAGSR